MRTVWLNGEFIPETEAKVSIFDRALTFGQGVYEVCPVIDCKFRNWPHHAARLERSKAMARIVDDTAWPEVMQGLIERNGLDEGRVYLQLTGGAPSDRQFLSSVVAPAATRVAYTQADALLANPVAQSGQRIMLRPDLRWGLRAAKTTQLLYAVLMKEEAREAGADDAWLVEGGVITEATSSNAHIIDARGILVSHPVDYGVLPGITRLSVLRIAREIGLAIDERPFTPDELYGAREAFISGAGSLVLPVVEVDGHPIADGQPGAITRDIRARYIDLLRAS